MGGERWGTITDHPVIHRKRIKAAHGFFVLQGYASLKARMTRPAAGLFNSLVWRLIQVITFAALSPALTDLGMQTFRRVFGLAIWREIIESETPAI